MICSGSKWLKYVFSYIWLPHPLLKHIIVAKYVSNSFFRLPHRHMWLFMPIYKCLWATSNVIQDTFNITTKNTPIFVDFFPIFLRKNLMAVSMATDQQIQEIIY